MAALSHFTEPFGPTELRTTTSQEMFRGSQPHSWSQVLNVPLHNKNMLPGLKHTLEIS